MKTLQQFAKFILYGAILAAVAVAFWKSGVMNVLDEHILLEYTHPDYYEISNSAEIRKLPLEYYNNGSANLIVNNISTSENDKGFTVTSNTDGSLTFVGTNNSDETAYVNITNGYWDLADGSYVLTDRPDDCQNGTPIGTSEFRVAAMARRYHVGGQVDYIKLADSSDLSQHSFTTDHTQYNDYYVQIIIAAGYSSDGITIYPMLTSDEELSNEYQPALLYKTSVYSSAETPIDMTTYTHLETSKENFLSLSDADTRLLDRYLQYQASNNGRYTTIDFGDGTGIYYPDSDPDQLQYGEIDTVGMISQLYGGTEQIAIAEEPLAETTIFTDYLKALNNENYTIFVAIRDDGVAGLTDYMMILLEELGLQTNLIDRPDNGALIHYRNSYYAVLNPGQPSVEEVSEEALSYTGTTRDGLHTVTIQSAGWLTEDTKGLIQIDGTEYSMNRRGMNFVVYDNAAGTVVDQVTFDTNSSMRAYRELPSVATE